MKRFLQITIVMMLLAALTVVAVAADNTASSMRLQSTQGTVTVKNAAGAKVSVSSGMRLNSGYKITTGKNSSAYISLDSTKTAKLNASSTAQVCKSGNKLEIRAVSGKLSFNVSAPVGKKEKTTIRTATMVTGVRGTFGWADVVNPFESRVYLAEGKLLVYGLNSETGQMESELIEGGQMARVYGDNEAMPMDEERVQVIDFDESVMPGFVAAQIVEDPELMERIDEESPLEADKIRDSAAQFLEQEAKELEEREKQLQQELKAAGIVADEEEAVPSGGGGGSALPEMFFFLDGSTSFRIEQGSTEDFYFSIQAYSKYVDENTTEEEWEEVYNSNSYISDVNYEYRIDGEGEEFAAVSMKDGGDFVIEESGEYFSKKETGKYKVYIRARAEGYAEKQIVIPVIVCKQVTVAGVELAGADNLGYDGNAKEPTVNKVWVVDGYITDIDPDNLPNDAYALSANDFKVDYSNNIDAGNSAEVYIQPNEDSYYEFRGKEVYFTIAPKVLENPTIELEYGRVFYDGNAKTPYVRIKDGNNEIFCNESDEPNELNDYGNYDVEYSDNTDEGTVTATINLYNYRFANPTSGSNPLDTLSEEFEIIKPEIIFGADGSCYVGISVEAGGSDDPPVWESLIDSADYDVETTIKRESGGNLVVSATVKGTEEADIAGTAMVSTDSNIPYNLNQWNNGTDINGIMTALGKFNKVVIEGLTNLSTGSNTVTINGNLTLGSGTTCTVDSGSLEIEDGGVLNIASGGTLTINAGGALTVKTGGTLTLNSSGTINNSGTWNIKTEGVFVDDGGTKTGSAPILEELVP